jgi:SAM-dependent methyltransferase
MPRWTRRRVVVLGLLLGLLLSIQWTAAKGAPWAPTHRTRVRRMLDLARVRPGEVVYDLGSGDGRILLAAARRYGARAVGVEIDPLRYALTRAAVAIVGLSGLVAVRFGDLFRADLSEADVVTCYLWQDTNDALESKLASELRPGARVVSHRYTFPGLRLVDADPRELVYVYEIGTRGPAHDTAARAFRPLRSGRYSASRKTKN